MIFPDPGLIQLPGPCVVLGLMIRHRGCTCDDAWSHGVPSSLVHESPKRLGLMSTFYFLLY